MQKLKTIKALAVGASLVCSLAAHASLVFDSTASLSGRGFGSVNNVLTFQSAGTPMTPASLAGGVEWDGTDSVAHDNTAGSVEFTGADKSGTWSFSDLGVTEAKDILFIWNPAETGGTPENRVDMAVLNIYDIAGVLAWSSGYGTTLDGVCTGGFVCNRISDAGFSAQLHASTENPGVGGSGFGYSLDMAQTTDLDSFLTGFGDFSALRIGLYAEHSMMDNGPDTWRIGANPGQPPVLLPEPGSLALFGLALSGLALVRRRRRQH